ncbi:hypothetical protein CDD82_7268 [Ophiocordyceps australis]|uniref:Uncharacterized protein n=1 Tax=Ophiocordyceps australis TaxID=1399860 RepID=A0A2C5YN55_9HYPO|nr:hypothetical protein CDD82_7268 [Ophiocordyceps australis]
MLVGTADNNVGEDYLAAYSDLVDCAILPQTVHDLRGDGKHGLGEYTDSPRKRSKLCPSDDHHESPGQNTGTKTQLRLGDLGHVPLLFRPCNFLHQAAVNIQRRRVGSTHRAIVPDDDGGVSLEEQDGIGAVERVNTTIQHRFGDPVKTDPIFDIRVPLNPMQRGLTLEAFRGSFKSFFGL